MPQASDTQGILRQNLIDAGCDPDTVSRCMALACSEKSTELTRILSHHRRELLNIVHQKEKQIDCLDYLIYNLEKQNH